MELATLSMAQWAAVSPALTYLIVSSFYETLYHFNAFPQYCLVRSEEETRRTPVPKLRVLQYVASYNIAITCVLLVLPDVTPSSPKNAYDVTFVAQLERLPLGDFILGHGLALSCLTWLFTSALFCLRMFLAFVVLDTWAFWCHWFQHKNAWLYRNTHALHHKIHAPYAFGAWYNHWAESLIVDSFGGLLAVTIIGLSDMEQVIFFASGTAKAVEDHSAYVLPWSPFTIIGRWTGNGVEYHDTHHHPRKVKYNLQIYFTWWDSLMGTNYAEKRIAHGKVKH
ncbi:hypothetical protein PFICI_04340 [Pestalotiopsis fici W106-1]|uniref:Fatty acid hydroxylase domain-containing protein n=1 Tax=Pestalotiopsis fici (strain W106-1 / CGMCC3.15140) TaxID=1229662 RepID=W3X8V8_PESFW|nr:uncharacterized protein PFICI_04340 [Pestalotiopsis fici W106-1]ETS82464.1 hypothetical protein PFICI_04340 [Pestalotiopsis fici W106-1]